MNKIVIKHFVALSFLFFGGFSGGLFAQHPALGGGTGTSTDPYQIKTPAHLKTLADFVNGGTANGDTTAGVYYIVINDLDLTAYAAGEGWNPIGYFPSSTDYSYFQGNFNGNGKKVTNLKINRPTANVQGLFGSINGATIENLGIENCDIAGQSYVGGLAGFNTNSSTISNCYATGNVSGTGNYVGGLVGYNENSTISNCYATGNVSGTSVVGGLAGNNLLYSTISNCYATGNVSGAGTNGYVGGLVGFNSSSSISNCYATGNVSGSTSVGGLAGYSSSSSSIKNCIAANDSVVSTTNTANINRISSNTNGTFQNNYALSTMAVKNSSGNVSITPALNTNAGMSKTMTDFQNLYFYSASSNWADSAWGINDPSGVWQICPYDAMMPVLRWQNFICYVPVDAITGLPTTASAGVPLTLTGTVSPSDATNQTITWSVKNAGTTGAVISGNTLNTTATGTATLTATIVNGLTKTTDYKQDFVVTVSAVGIVGAYSIRPIEIYPNPTNGQLRVSGDILDGRDREIIIFDVIGQVVFTSQLSKLSPETTIDISHLSAGLYFLKVNGKMVKVVKE